MENNFFARVLQDHSGELTILVIAILLFVTLLMLVPQLLRANRHASETRHEEHLRALERGLPIPPEDERFRAAGRVAALVPMVVVCAAGAVTCFLAAYKYENLFPVSLAIWSVAGVVCLAAITGGVALMGRLAQLQSEDDEDEPPQNPLANKH